MNIIHIISSRGWGGAENSAAYLAQKQIKHGHKAFFFIHSLNNKLKYVLDNNNVPYFSAFDPEKKNVFAIKKLIKTCEKENIDIIHTHLATGNYLGVVAGNYLKIPVVSTINIFSGSPYYALADKLCFASEAVKNYFLGYFSSGGYASYRPTIGEKIINKVFGLKYKPCKIEKIRDKGEVTYERIDESKFVEYDVPMAGYDDYFNIGITGRVTGQKGQAYFIKAAKLLLKELKNLKAEKWLRFHIVGSGPDEKKLRKLVEELELQNNFKFWGYQKDVRPLVKIFDIAVSCSLNEPFGINLIEYMFMKKPCVAPAAGGIPEVLGDTGLLVPPEDPVSLKDALEKYICNPKLMSAEGQKGFDRAVKLFSSETSLSRLDEVYGKISK